ncbi:MAG: S-layer homology domain-containing protein, partial [Thermoleophilia bacterium]|nr:S-layer homology domain-containing protein [Thermoleophilia bacterium]
MRLEPMLLRSIARRPRRRLGVNVCVGALVLVVLTLLVASLALALSPNFPDVPASHQYYTAITDLASRGIINGYTNGNFGPGDTVTRQQFAKMIVGTGGYSVSENDVCRFTDVEKGDATTFYPDNFVAVCAAQGITTGKTATTFDPSGKITRYQVISMVVRTADNLQPGSLDAPPAGWTATGDWGNDSTHGANARRAEYNGLLAGLDLSALGPYGNMTRGEVAQVLHNLLGRLAPPTTTTTTEVTTTTSSSTTTTVPAGHFENLGGEFTSGPGVCEHNPEGSGWLVLFVRGTDSAL